MPSTEFKLAIAVIKQPHTYALDRTTTGNGSYYDSYMKRKCSVKNVDFLNVTIDSTYVYVVITGL
jgi:hypothetical protein